jgi:ArsR family transcriptional regulator, arsenate/arsenite/antimonite-responsive transcriptional repressor
MNRAPGIASAPTSLAAADLSACPPLLRALADEARLEIVARLAAAGGAVCVCDLTRGLGLAQPTVSHHLRVLRDAGIVRSERRGTWVYYEFDGAVIGVLGSLITALAPPRFATSVADPCAPRKKAS